MNQLSVKSQTSIEPQSVAGQHLADPKAEVCQKIGAKGKQHPLRSYNQKSVYDSSLEAFSGANNSRLPRHKLGHMPAMSPFCRTKIKTPSIQQKSMAGPFGFQASDQVPLKGISEQKIVAGKYHRLNSFNMKTGFHAFRNQKSVKQAELNEHCSVEDGTLYSKVPNQYSIRQGPTTKKLLGLHKDDALSQKLSKYTGESPGMSQNADGTDSFFDGLDQDSFDENKVEEVDDDSQDDDDSQLSENSVKSRNSSDSVGLDATQADAQSNNTCKYRIQNNFLLEEQPEEVEEHSSDTEQSEPDNQNIDDQYPCSNSESGSSLKSDHSVRSQKKQKPTRQILVNQVDTDREQQDFELLTPKIINEEIQANERCPLVKIETVREIGDGMHANIFLAHRIQYQDDEASQKENICVKVFKTDADKDCIACAKEEFKIAKILHGNQNIIKINSFEEKQPITIDGITQIRDYLILEYCQHGDLFTYFCNYGDFHEDNGSLGNDGLGMLSRDTKLFVSICRQLIQALSVLHEKAGYAHMDVKLENVLIDDQGTLKICDFGFSTPHNCPVNMRMGTPIYMAPEIHRAPVIPCEGQPSDVFSLGVLFFVLAFGAPPFKAAVSNDIYFNYLAMKPGNKDFFKYHPHTKLLYKAGKIPESFIDLMIKMLMAKPENRVKKLSELLESDFLKLAEDQIDEQYRLVKNSQEELIKHSETKLNNGSD